MVARFNLLQERLFQVDRHIEKFGIVQADDRIATAGIVAQVPPFLGDDAIKGCDDLGVTAIPYRAAYVDLRIFRHNKLSDNSLCHMRL
jgi:hypothetical protein